MREIVLEDVALVMHGRDQVAIAKHDIAAGTCLTFNGVNIVIREMIKKAHRFSLRNIPQGGYVSHCGIPFGMSCGIGQGYAVSDKNITEDLPDPDNTASWIEPGISPAHVADMTFLGYRRSNGGVGTRNYYVVIPTSMCSSETAVQIAQNIERDEAFLKTLKNCDGVVALPHTEGCGCAANPQIDRLLSVLRGYIVHPNAGGCLLIDLGCEQTNYEKVYNSLSPILPDIDKPIDWVTIQEVGGTRKAIEISGKIVRQRLPEINSITRESCSIKTLVIGTECGASDSFSGITANPVIGRCVDKVIYAGGKAILSEVPELVGTLPMMLPRFKDRDVERKFKHLFEYYGDMALRLGLTMKDNLVPKNKEGGLINNTLKSIGAALKGGTTIIADVIDYGEPARKDGLSIMQGPGGDPESLTGIVAGGATIVLFSTGYGAITGNPICPVIRLSSTTELAQKLPEDIDFDAGKLLHTHGTIDELSDDLMERLVAVSSGEKTWSEKWKQRQFQIWTVGKLSL